MLFPVIVKKLKTMEVSILIIRQERPEDYDTVYHVVKEAFENAEYTDGNEQNLVAALRKSKSFIPELSLVAVEDEKIVGHILFTKAACPSFCITRLSEQGNRIIFDERRTQYST